MKQIFTRLVSVGIACFCIASVTGQEKDAVVSVFESKYFLEKNVNLRSSNIEYWWPDSLIWYNPSGIPVSKKIFDKDKKTEVGWGFWENGNWIFDSEPVSSNGFYFEKTKVDVYASSGRIGIQITTSDGGWIHYYSLDWQYYPKYDANGNLILLEIKPNDEDYFIEYRISYNDTNDPVLVEENNNNFENRIYLFEYNEKGHLVQFERYLIDEETKLPKIADGYIKETVEFDEQVRPVANHQYRGSASLNEWLLESYRIIYYSDDVTTNEQIESFAPTAYIIGQTLYIRTEKTEQIAIFSIMGHKLYDNAIQSGLNTINTSQFPQGILFVKGSSGWTKKLIAK